MSKLMTDKHKVDYSEDDKFIYLRNQVIWFLLKEYHQDIIDNAESFVKKYLEEEEE
jgi:hypothetical protein